jgi:multicomponent Na+:H+ antiporter subunit B
VSRRARLALFAVAGPGFGVVLVLGLTGLPAFGDYHGVYGLLLNRIELPLRHATDIVTALNFDIRAFDTLGEEFLLFTSVVGVAVLLRHLRDEEQEGSSKGIEDRRFGGASTALGLSSLVLVPLVIALGCYVVVHGQLTPGGGFQGGVILAAGAMAMLIAGRYLALKHVAPEAAIEGLESVGAAGYAAIGLAGLILGAVFFKNFLPLGTPGHLLSAGTMPINSVAVGLEVTGAFLLTWTEFLDQALIAAPRDSAKG